MIQVMDLISGEFRGSSLPSRNRGYGYESWLYIVGRDISVRETCGSISSKKIKCL